MAQHKVVREQVSRKCTITDGPSLDAMLDSLKESDPRYRKSVSFKVYSSDSNFRFYISLKIEKLEREDGSGKNWMFGGWAEGNKRVDGFFNTERRSGYLTIQD